MKNTDIALIILIAVISVIASYFVTNAILGDPSESVEEISYIAEVSNEVIEPDLETFNVYSINPTVDVHIGRCEVGQVYVTATGECRDISSDNITIDVADPNDEE